MIQNNDEYTIKWNEFILKLFMNEFYLTKTEIIYDWTQHIKINLWDKTKMNISGGFFWRWGCSQIVSTFIVKKVFFFFFFFFFFITSAIFVSLSHTSFRWQEKRRTKRISRFTFPFILILTAIPRPWFLLNVSRFFFITSISLHHKLHFRRLDVSLILSFPAKSDIFTVYFMANP